MINSDTIQRMGVPRGITWFMGLLAACKFPVWLMKRVVRRYIRAYNINMDEYEYEPARYTSFNAFFTRHFKPGMRNFAEGVASPAEGLITAAGSFDKGQLFHVKGSYYPVSALLNQEVHIAEGSFATIYLSPADYHRVHAPFDCTVTRIDYRRGKLKTVKPGQVSKEPLLYCENDRVIIEGISEYGRFFMVLVGAVVVGKIKLAFIDGVRKGCFFDNLQTDLIKGEEAGLFELGSTVILLFENDTLAKAELLEGKHVLLGESLLNCINEVKSG